MNVLFIFISIIFIERGTKGGNIGHYKVGTDFYNRPILQNKDLLRVPLGFEGVAHCPDAPFNLQQPQFFQFLSVSSDRLF